MSLDLKNEGVTTHLSKMYLDVISADVKFKFRTDNTCVDIIPAHKAILGSASQVFYSMFFGLLKEGETIDIIDASPEGFKEFLKLFYLKDIILTFDNLGEIVSLADKYDMTNYLKAYVSSLKYRLTEENLVLAYKLALELNDDDFKKSCEIKITQSSGLCKTEAFLQIDEQVLKHILELNTLACSEIDLFKGCFAWAQSSCQDKGLDAKDAKNVRQQLGECFQLIRFGAMDNKTLAEIINNETYAALFTFDEVLDLLRISTSKEFKSVKFNQIPRLKFNPFLDSTFTFQMKAP